MQMIERGCLGVCLLPGICWRSCPLLGSRPNVFQPLEYRQKDRLDQFVRCITDAGAGDYVNESNK